MRQLHIVDADGSQKTVDDAAVVFTPGWLFVQEASIDGYVVPRERVLMVEGVKRPRSHGLAGDVVVDEAAGGVGDRGGDEGEAAGSS